MSFLKNPNGPTATECGLIAALIAIVILSFTADKSEDPPTGDTPSVEKNIGN